MITKALRPGLVILVVLLSFLALGPAVGSSLWWEQAELQASDGGTDDRFGSSVALSGDTALIGAFLHDVGVSPDAGAAYVFRWNGSQWVEQAQLTASDGEKSDWFGWSVALSGNTALVGAVLDDVEGNEEAGSAYVYRWDGSQWVEETKLTASDGAAFDRFGIFVALSGDTALVGAWWDDVEGITDAGSAYVYSWDGVQWVEQAKVTASDGAEGANFGFSVDVDGNKALVGAILDDAGGVVDAGSAYLLQWNGGQWVEHSKLTASDGEAGDEFRVSVSLSTLTGISALVGARYDDIGGVADAGSAYAYYWDGSQWVEQAKLTAVDGEENDQYGRSVAINGNTALIGARFDDIGAVMDTGSAHMYRWDGSQWTLQIKLSISDAEDCDWFGRSVALSGNNALISANKEDVGDKVDAGTAYMFRWQP